LYLSVYARASKRSRTGGKCVTCCGLPFYNIAEVGITRPKWREIKTAVIHKTLNIYRANAEEEEEGGCVFSLILGQN
jgi:hypothetical protein